MAVQYTTYNTDGTTRTFPSTKHIATIQHVGVYLKRVVDNVWVVVNVNDYALVQNSIIFDTAPDSVLYAQVEVRVADDAAEITTSPSDIALVAGSIVNVDTVATNIGAVNTVATNVGAVTTTSGSIANVNTVAANIVNVNTVGSAIVNVNTVATNIANVNSVATTIVPNIAEILLADDNATIATTQAGIATTQAGLASTSATSSQLRAWEAEAEKLTADSYATEPENVFVKTYVSDGDGTFTATNTSEYSALHWSYKALINANFAPAINSAAAKTTPADADLIGLVDSADSFSLKKTTWANIKATLAVIFAPIASPAFTGTPTAPTATAGTDTTQLATTAFTNIMSGGSVVPAKSLTANGYLKMANGVIIQWQVAVVASTVAYQTTVFTFPIAFPTACTSVSAIGSNSPAVDTFLGVAALSVASVTISHRVTIAQNIGIYIIAIGY